MPWRRFSIFFFFSLTQDTRTHTAHQHCTCMENGVRFKARSFRFRQGVRIKHRNCFIEPFHLWNFLTFFYFFLPVTAKWVAVFLARSDSRSCSGCHSLARSCQDDLQYFNMGHWATPLKYEWEVEFDWSGFLIAFWWTTYIVLPKSLVFTVLPD